MRRIFSVAISWLLLAMALCRPFAVHAAERRVALVIGNAAYEGDAALSNPVNDARLVAQTLRELNFDVVGPKQGVLENLDREALQQAFADFGKLARKADVVFVYYSGHGMKGARGGNYLIPVRAKIENDDQIRFRAVAVDELLDELGNTDDQLRIVVVDACRNNPFGDRKRGDGTKGLGRQEQRAGTLVAFATGEGQTALDGKGQNSPYAAALARHLKTGGLDVKDVFDRVAEDVYRATEKRQRPMKMDDVLGKHYLAGAAPVAVSTQMVSIKPEPAPRPQLITATSMLPAASGSQAGNVFRDCAQCPEMVWVPAGSFTMGSNDDVAEKPVHSIRIDYQFAAGKFPVTRAQFAQFVQESGYDAGNKCWIYARDKWTETAGRNWRSPGYPQGDDHPVVCVSWQDAQAYVNWLKARTGKGYRLLSEAEYEYAARAGTTTKYFWGDTVSRDRINYGADQCCTLATSGKQWEYTSPAGSFPSNQFGLHDMLGNVWEWAEDCWNDRYDGAPADGSVWKSGECARRVVRGGSWFNLPRLVRASSRYRFGSSVRNGNGGFRVARSIQ